MTANGERSDLTLQPAQRRSSGAELDTVKSNVFARTAIRYIYGLPEVRLLKEAVVMFD